MFTSPRLLRSVCISYAHKLRGAGRNVKRRFLLFAGNLGAFCGVRGLGRATLLAAAFSWAAPAGAGFFSERLLFSANNQSQWSSGPAVNIGGGDARFIGVPGFSERFEIGKVVCFFACGGAEIRFGVSGGAGINYAVRVDSGSLNVEFGPRVTFTVPNPEAVHIGGLFDIVTQVRQPPGVSFGIGTVPILRTTGPTAQALIGMELAARLEAVARVCVVGCLGPNLDVGVNLSQELLAINNFNDGQIRVLGREVGRVGGPSQTVNRGALSLNVALPTLNTDSRSVGGFNGNVLRSSSRSNILSLGVSLDKVVSDLLGLPPLNAKSGGFGYNIVTANAGLGIDVSQRFTFNPTTTATLNFTSPVIRRTSSGLFPLANATTSLTFNVGETLTLRAPGAASLGIAPRFTLDNTTRNETGLSVNSDFYVSAGGISAFGLDAGPIFQRRAASTVAEIPLFAQDFRVDVPSIATTPFNIVFNPLFNAVATPAGEPFDPCVFVDSCNKSGFVSSPVFQATDSFRIANLFDRVARPGTGCRVFGLDEFGRVCDNRFADVFFNVLAGLGDSVRVGDISPSFVESSEEGFNRVFGAAVQPPELAPFAVLSDTDAGALQRLAALGFVRDFAPFIVPPGDPFPTSVPEPGSLLLVLTGLLAAAGWRRRG